jgi:aldehyde dehydrogenase (NAD+)
MWYEPNLLIDGELVPATGGRTYDSINPATGDVIAPAADATVDDTERAVQAARRAFDETDWSTNTEFRIHCLRQLVQALRDNVEDLRALTIADVGVPVGLTAGPALEGTFEIPEYYANLLESYEFGQDIGTVDGMAGPSHLWMERTPIGVVSAITGYNYPHQLNLAKLGPALAAGCTVVVKGAPQTPLVTLALGKLIAEHTDIPAGVVSVLTSSEVAPGELLTTHPEIDMITFTGSTATGRRIAAAAAPTLKKCFFELGGKSALVVLDEESLPLGAMVGSFATASHSGQGCAITSRLVVPREHYESAVEQAAGMMAGLTVGDPSDPANYMGPLITQQQLDKVQGMVDRAREGGARVVCGGGRPDGLDRGFFFQPTLIADADENSEIAQDEVFGPVLVVQAHDGDDDAVRVANNSYYGLSGMVAAADHDRAKAVARRIRSGTMSVNGGGWHHVSAPFGGVKQSGYGRENGVPGLEEFLTITTYAEPADKAG